MNLDFHYYGTYTAAIFAGFNKAESERIARAAQFVDDFDPKELREMSGDIRPTVDHSMISNAIKDFFCRLFKDTTRKYDNIWIPFHFLPGYCSTYYRRNNAKPEILDAELDLLTHPDTPLSYIIAEWCTNNMQTEGWEERLGVAMHIIADTYAHRDFCGTRIRKLNNAKDGVYGPDGRILPGFPELISTKEVCLGHGALAHLPDYGYLNYNYKPAWRNNDDGTFHNHNNPESFLAAFLSMYRYLYKARAGNMNAERELDETRKQIVENIIRTPEKDQCATWVNELNALTMCPTQYDKNYYYWQPNFDALSFFNSAVTDYLIMITPHLRGLNIDTQIIQEEGE